MAAPDARERLVDFLEARVFRPVLDAVPEDYDSANDRERLARLKHATHAEADRYRGLQTIEEVVEEYRVDLELERERDVFGELRELGLPALPDVREEFERTARELGYAE